MSIYRSLFNQNSKITVMDEFTKKLRTAQAHLVQADKQLAKLIASYGDCTLRPHTDYYGELVASIIGQQLSEKAGATIYNRFIGLFNGKLPTPEQIVATDNELIRSVGCSYSKANYMKDLAQHIIDGRLDMGHIATLPNPEVVRQLVAVKGIGEWSAHMFMIFSLGRLDILPTGDLGIRKAMMRQYGLSELPGPAAMHEIALTHHWTPYQSVASWYLWRSLNNQSRYRDESLWKNNVKYLAYVLTWLCYGRNLELWFISLPSPCVSISP
jgi:DNA-3-methyladenine glycosylase II